MTHVAHKIMEMLIHIPQMVLEIPDPRGIFKIRQVLADVFHVFVQVPDIGLQVHQVIDKFPHGFSSLICGFVNEELKSAIFKAMTASGTHGLVQRHIQA
jgi:hypothetical protein